MSESNYEVNELSTLGASLRTASNQRKIYFQETYYRNDFI